MINVAKNSRLPAQKVKDAYHLLNTTSPSPLLLADVESCVRVLHKDGKDIVDNALNLSKKIKDTLSKLPQIILGDFEAFKSDPLKTIVKIKGISGHEFCDMLDKKRINVEKSTNKCIVISCHINITEEDVD